METMSPATVKVASRYDAVETYQKLKELFDDAAELRKLDPKASFEFDDAALSGVARGRQFRAELKVKEVGEQAVVHVGLTLPFLLSAFQGQITREVEKQLIAAIGVQKAAKPEQPKDTKSDRHKGKKASKQQDTKKSAEAAH